MRGGYVIARENFKEAEKHVSAETDPVMFNLIYGLQSLTEQIAMDFAALHEALATLDARAAKSGAATAGAAKAAKRPRSAKAPKRSGGKGPRRSR
jgi:3-oxoacyl-ACP reductase-like protein